MTRKHRTHRSRARRKRAGFTMIEVMVALLLTAIAASGIIALFMVQTRSAGYSRHATEATILAQDEMERLRAMNINGGSNSTSGINELGQSGGIFTRSWEITAGGAGSHVDVTVTVSWNEDGNATPRSVTLVSRKTP
ncbi:MAG: prepilin-type N-terminal cleavage/methylation domain-containing protein [Kofleriaceae bacterium]